LIIALSQKGNNLRAQGQQDAEQSRRTRKRQSLFRLSCLEHQMEAGMSKYRITIAGTLVIAAAALLAPGCAEAGASASAASKYPHTAQVAAAHQVRTDRLARSNFPITEYSSSSARNSQQH